MASIANERVQPRPVGWFVASLTLLFALFLTYVAVVASEYARRSVAFARARAAVVEGNFGVVDHLLQAGQRREGLSRFVPSSLALWASDEGFSEATLQRFADLIKLVKEEKLSAAGELFRELAPEIAVSADQLGEPVDQLLEKLDKLMAQAIEGYLRKRESSTEYQRYETEHSTIATNHITVSRELGTLLGLSASNKAELGFYKDGILKGLPLVTNVPDKIESLSSLAEVLKRSGGRVQVPDGVNAHQFFLERLEDMKTRSFAVKLQLESNNERRGNLRTKIKLGTAKLSDAAPYLVKQFSSVLIIASRSTIQEGNMVPHFVPELIDNYLT